MELIMIYHLVLYYICLLLIARYILDRKPRPWALCGSFLVFLPLLAMLNDEVLLSMAYFTLQVLQFVLIKCAFKKIKITNLIPELLKLVDEERIALTPAVELSYLKEQEQYDLMTTIESEDCTPSLSQAVRLKKLSQAGQLNADKIFAVMSEEKANQKERIRKAL